MCWHRELAGLQLSHAQCQGTRATLQSPTATSVPPRHGVGLAVGSTWAGGAQGAAGSGHCPGMLLERPRRSWAGAGPQLEAGRERDEHSPAQGEAPGHEKVVEPSTCTTRAVGQPQSSSSQPSSPVLLVQCRTGWQQCQTGTGTTSLHCPGCQGQQGQGEAGSKRTALAATTPAHVIPLLASHKCLMPTVFLYFIF